MKTHSRATRHHEKVSDHAQSLIAATSHIAETKVAEARQKLSDAIESAKDAVEFVEEKAMAAARQGDEFIREKPYQAVGIALGIGALIGFCIARRK